MPSSLVREPIRKTNVVLKNVNFQYAMKLWSYLRDNYNGGFSEEVQEMLVIGASAEATQDASKTEDEPQPGDYVIQKEAGRRFQLYELCSFCVYFCKDRTQNRKTV